MENIMAREYKVENLVNRKFGRLLVIRYALRNKYNHIMWKCICDCGNYVKVSSNDLKSSNTRSCGCLGKEVRVQSAKQWTYKHGMSKTKFYIHWSTMIQRCTNFKNPSYNRYGGRGIIHDKKWKTFEGFKDDMYFKYIWAKKKYGDEKLISLERENVNGNYEFNNCIFILKRDQYNNYERQKWFKAISPNGEEFMEKNLKRFCDNYNLNRRGVYDCLNNRLYCYTVKGWKFKYMKGGD
jgi:hypothetical protein